MSETEQPKLTSIQSRPHLLGVLAGLFLSAGLVFSAMTVSRAWLKISEGQVIAVTGSAKRTIQSDLIIWSGSFSANGQTLLEARKKLQRDLEQVEAFLRGHNVTNYQISPIGIQELSAQEKNADGSTYTRSLGYRLTHEVEARMGALETVTKLDRETTSLVENDILFTTNTPRYIYTKAGETKVEMLAEASKDARNRAEQIAGQGGRSVENMLSAKMGVFQITPAYVSQTSAEGLNDNTSFEKVITAVVSATFSMK
jgi:hypothetical protein